MKFSKLFISVLLAVYLLAVVPAGAYQNWQVRGGTVSVTLYRQLLDGMGLRLTVKQSATPQGDMEEAVGCAIKPGSNLSFRSEAGRFQNWEAGSVSCSGGFDLASPRGRLSVRDFTLSVLNDGGFELNTAALQNVFDINRIKVVFDHAKQTVTFGYADLVLRPAAAQALGRPDLAGEIVGMLAVSGRGTFIGGDPNEQGPPPTIGGGGGTTDSPNGDVQLFQLLDCSSFGRVGSYPNGTSGLGVGTTSCNVSNITGDNANWYRQMDERHPVIAQNMYRIRTVNGAERFEQIGLGWVKHGFLSTNSNGCGTCQVPPAGGDQLGIHCSDTYGSSLNASRSYLGPRNEINPFTGRWTCTGSYFSNYQNDCLSRFNTGGLDAVAHRLQVKDQDLIGGGTFIYEAYYVSENDVDRYNAASWKTCVPTWNTGSSTWNFGSTGPQVFGAAVQGWNGANANTAQPTTEGDVIVACKPTNIGNGFWHYEYVVYVHTLDRQVRSFTVPISDGVTIANVEFRDPDGDATNDWSFSRVNCQAMWKTQTFAENPNANSLKWGSTYNFRFDANVPPANTTGVMNLFKPGTLQTLTVATRGPSNPYTLPTSMTVGPGSVQLGTVGDLICSDDSGVQMKPGIVFSNSSYPMQMVLEGTSQFSQPSTMILKVESAAIPSIQQRLELYNFSTGLYEAIDTRPCANTDTNIEVPATGAVARFVETGTNKIRARISYRATAVVFAYPWTVLVDEAVWIITP